MKVYEITCYDSKYDADRSLGFYATKEQAEYTLKEEVDLSDGDYVDYQVIGIEVYDGVLKSSFVTGGYDVSTEEKDTFKPIAYELTHYDTDYGEDNRYGLYVSEEAAVKFMEEVIEVRDFDRADFTIRGIEVYE